MSVRIRLMLLMLFLLILPTILPVATPAYADACFGNVSCPDPKSCGSWSSYYSCDSPFCDWDSFCESKSDGVTTFRPRERFRDCWLQDNSHCREYQYSVTLFCGCNA